jgi:hypothetical protein
MSAVLILKIALQIPHFMSPSLHCKVIKCVTWTFLEVYFPEFTAFSG